MLQIPITSKTRYVSSIVALNIHSPQGTGDWHSAAALSKEAFPTDFYLYGDAQPYNTNAALGTEGIIDGTQRLQKMGYRPVHTPVWIADHPRALVDYLYYAVLKTGNLGRVMLDEWFPTAGDKQEVYALINRLEPILTEEEKGNLVLWKKKNPID